MNQNNSVSDKTFTENLPDGIVVLDCDEQLLWLNKVAQQLLRKNNTTDISESVANFLKDINLKGKLKDYLEQSIDISLPQQVDTKLHVSILTYHDQGYLLILKDVTEMHHLGKMRQEFVANVSHELRTPLTVIHGYLETLLNQELNIDPAWIKIFEQMYQQGVRMEKLVEGLLLLSRLESDLPEDEAIQTIDIPAMLNTIVEDAIALSGDMVHQIKAEIEENLFLHGEESKLRSAFSNIIFNAVNYTPERGEILIRWYSDDNNAYLSVIDKGIGIEKKHLPRLVERFYRIDKARSRASGATGGTGLGLAIVKHVLIRHDGHLDINSTVGEGSTFTCVFPKKSIKRQ